MRNGQYIKRLKYRVQLSKPKIMRFAPERNQPHAITKVVLVIENKELVPELVGCTCLGCIEYLRQLSKYNPLRFRALTQPDEPQGFSRRKALPDDVHKRRMLAQAILKWR